MAIEQFKLPDLGEGLTEGDILKWMVAVGDTVAVNDTIAEVETVKAAVELPSPWAGVVTALHAAEGETVPVGTAIISIDTGATRSDGGGAGSGVSTAPSTAPDDMVPGTPTQDAVAGLPGEGALPPEEKQMTLVGYGPREETATRRRRRSGAPGHRPAAASTGASAQTAFNIPPARTSGYLVEQPQPTAPAPAQPADGGANLRVLAKPPVRKLAKQLGVDLTSVTPTGPEGTISREDVQSAAEGVASAPAAAAMPLPAPGTRETRVPIRGVRKHTAAAMVASAFTAPHVTEFVTVDVTATMELRDRVAARRDFRDVKVSPLLFVAKACLLAMARTPEINATWDDAATEIVLKHYVNLGIAAATPRGLIVPNIKDAEQLSLLELAKALTELAETARAGRTTPADMSGGTFTITNVGVFGVDTGTPIINPGESAILAFGAVRRMPWVVDGDRIEPRWVTQLAVSFDHRLIDGQQGSQFLADVAAVLQDPGMALL